MFTGETAIIVCVFLSRERQLGPCKHITQKKKKKPVACSVVIKSAGIELSLHNTTGQGDVVTFMITSLILHSWHIYNYNL